MSPITLFCLLAAVSFSLAASEVLPDEFYGTYDLDHSDNFDAYLTAKGFNFFIRQMAASATVRKVFARTSSRRKFDYSNLTSRKNVYYRGVVLRETFQGEGLDGSMHEVTFAMKNGHLLEHHTPLQGGEEETFAYLFQGDYLVMRLSFRGVKASRFFRRSA